MKISVDRILVTHTGSLPRSTSLSQPDTDPSAVTEAVADMVRQQLDAGLDVVNDGEVSKPSYVTYIQERLTGFAGQARPAGVGDAELFPEVYAKQFSDPAVLKLVALAPACSDPISYRGTEALHRDLDNLRAATSASGAVEAFMTAASPGVVALFHDNLYYPTHEEYLSAIADAMKQEYDAIHAAGFILQLDCPDLTSCGYNFWRDQRIEDMAEFRRHVALHLEVLNHATRDIPAEAMRMHVCWGNTATPHVTDAPLRELIEVLLTARPAGLVIEAANPRHGHEWSVFEDVPLPDGKVLLPGVIDSTTNFVEHPELVAQRIEQYARIVGKERVIPATDCGFATLGDYQPVFPSVVWAKLRSLVEGARIATARLS